MTDILVDSSVLLDILEQDADWYPWSFEQLLAHGDTGQLIINPVIYAEVSIGYAALEDLENALAEIGLLIQDTPREALFLAGKAFLQYRRKGGGRSAPLPDFFIGAHAAVTGMRLLTRDSARVSHYFPGVKLIAPDKK